MSMVTAGLERSGCSKHSGERGYFDLLGIEGMFSRDCNGVSNGIDLPRQVLQLENSLGARAGQALGADKTLYITNRPDGISFSLSSLVSLVIFRIWKRRFKFSIFKCWSSRNIKFGKWWRLPTTIQQ